MARGEVGGVWTPFCGDVDDARVFNTARYAPPKVAGPALPLQACFTPPSDAEMKADEHTLALFRFDAGLEGSYGARDAGGQASLQLKGILAGP